MKTSAAPFLSTLRSIAGTRHVITGPGATRSYSIGFRYGAGKVLAVVRPGTLLELWQVLQACVDANKIIIMQAANTGLTGGSTPNGDDYIREIVIINTMRMRKIHLVGEATQVICLPGATLYELENLLRPYGRDPHSVIGSSCIGASVIGGICNNSGGSLIRRGPAYTKMALFARLNANRELELINHLGVNLGDDPEEILVRLESRQFEDADIDFDPNCYGSDRDYVKRVREINADSPARYNADPGRLFEASGSAGRVALFAVRLDTFPMDKTTRVFYIGTKDPAELTSLRRHILSRFNNLPISGEYMHRELFNIAEIYGKDLFMIIQVLGAERLPHLLNLKSMFDSLTYRLGLHGIISSGRLLQWLSLIIPNHLPGRLKEFRDRFDHHLILKMSGDGILEAQDYLTTLFPSSSGDFFECTQEEADKAFRHRFVAANAAMRYAEVHPRQVEDIVALDVALRRDDLNWFESLPDDVHSQVHLALYYGHFFCHVFHQDYIVRKGSDSRALKDRLCRLLDSRGAKYPAEHNVGHFYEADSVLADFYRSLDPSNSFNPGIGQTTKLENWN